MAKGALITQNRTGKQLPLLVAAGCLSLLMLGCSSDAEEAELYGIGSGLTGGILYFKADVDNSLTSSCGSASADTGTSSSSTSSSSTSSSSSSSSSGGTTEATAYKISSYYIFKAGSGALTFDRVATLLLKYTYYTNRDSFSITPTSSSTTTCSTSDFVSCDGTGSFTCTTSDNVSCGGENSVIFTCSYGGCNGVSFEASTGTINWENGFTLSEDNTTVSSANLNFRLVNSDGSIVVVGSAFCESTEQ